MSDSENTHKNEKDETSWNDPIQESHVCGTTKALKLSIDQDQFFKERYINQELKVRQRLREK